LKNAGTVLHFLKWIEIKNIKKQAKVGSSSTKTAKAKFSNACHFTIFGRIVKSQGRKMIRRPRPLRLARLN